MCVIPFAADAEAKAKRKTGAEKCGMSEEDQASSASFMVDTASDESQASLIVSRSSFTPSLTCDASFAGAQLCNESSGNLNSLRIKCFLQIAMQKKLFEEAKAHAAGQV